MKAINKREFKRLLKKKTGCTIQTGGWCCGTCFFAIDDSLINEDWQSLLLYRGDYIKEELDNLPKDYMKSIRKIYRLIKG